MRSSTDLYFASLIGLLMTGIVVVITNYYTSMHYKPRAKKLARASENWTRHQTSSAGLAPRPARHRVAGRFSLGSRFLLEL